VSGTRQKKTFLLDTSGLWRLVVPAHNTNYTRKVSFDSNQTRQILQLCMRTQPPLKAYSADVHECLAKRHPKRSVCMSQHNLLYRKFVLQHLSWVVFHKCRVACWYCGIFRGSQTPKCRSTALKLSDIKYAAEHLTYGRNQRHDRSCLQFSCQNQHLDIQPLSIHGSTRDMCTVPRSCRKHGICSQSDKPHESSRWYFQWRLQYNRKINFAHDCKLCCRREYALLNRSHVQ
jgi:hypothetical protein